MTTICRGQRLNATSVWWTTPVWWTHSTSPVSGGQTLNPTYLWWRDSQPHLSLGDRHSTPPISSGCGLSTSPVSGGQTLNSTYLWWVWTFNPTCLWRTDTQHHLSLKDRHSTPPICTEQTLNPPVSGGHMQNPTCTMVDTQPYLPLVEGHSTTPVSGGQILNHEYGHYPTCLWWMDTQHHLSGRETLNTPISCGQITQPHLSLVEGHSTTPAW